MAVANPIHFSAETKRVLDRFSNFLFARCGFSASTVELTVGFARRMSQTIGLNPSHEDVERYIADMYRAGESYAHISNAIKAVERYMQFLGRPIHLGRPRKPQRADMAVLSEAKITLLIAACKNLRERAILSLLAYSGIRNRELISLRVRNVDPGSQTVTVECGKGAKGRVCYVAGECVEVLSDYLHGRGAGPDELLFVTVRHKHQLQTQDVRKIVRTIAKRAGINRRVWPHLLRHSLATALLDRGASIYSIQALLGHSWVSTTLEYYLHPGRKTVQADYCGHVPSYL